MNTVIYSAFLRFRFLFADALPIIGTASAISAARQMLKRIHPIPLTLSPSYAAKSASHMAAAVITRLEDIGVTEADLEKVLPKVLSMPDIAHNPYPVTLDMLSGAFRRLQDKAKKA